MKEISSHNLPEGHQHTDFVHLRLTGVQIVQPHLPTAASVALQDLEPVVHLVVDLVGRDLEGLHAGQVGHSAHVRQGPQLVVGHVKVGHGVQLGHAVEVPDVVCAEVQSEDLTDLGVETLHVSDLVLAEVEAPQMRQSGQVCDFFNGVGGEVDLL